MAEKRIQRASFGLSWADEVEREEREEEEEKAIRRKEEEKSDRKPNPFGAARPREVVLEEKGVDWRKFDEELDYHSNPRKNKKQKENISSSKVLQNLNQNKPKIQNAVTICPQQLNRHIDELVPPLKYPPKNIMALMEQIRRGRTSRLYEGVDNLHLNQYPCNSSHMMGHMKHWPIDASHSQTAQAHFNVSMIGAGYVGVCPKFGTMRGGENMGLNCKRKHFGDKYQSGRAEEVQANVRELITCRKSYSDDDGTGRGESYTQGKRFMRASEKQQANGRRILVDWNMDYAEDKNGRRNYNVQKSISPPRKPLGWEHGPQNHDAEKNCSGRIIRSASKMTKHVARANMGELVGRSKSAIEEVTRTKKGHDASNKKGSGSGDKKSKRRHRKQVRK